MSLAQLSRATLIDLNRQHVFYKRLCRTFFQHDYKRGDTGKVDYSKLGQFDAWCKLTQPVFNLSRTAITPLLEINILIVVVYKFEGGM
jgi:hypothetical protein